MKTVVAQIEGISPYSQGKPYEVDKLQGEGYDEYERRTWRNRMHVDSDGGVYIPPMAYKNALANAAKFLSLSVPGKGKAKYTKHFEAGVLAVKPAPLGVHVDAVASERLFVPSDGRRGGGNRVYRYFPLIPTGWKAEFEFIVVDDTVLQKMVGFEDLTVFEHVLRACGQYIGIGRFKPLNNGFYGRFQVNEFVVN